MFITFEGGEGSGKTTLIKRLETYLKEQRYKVLLTREPGGGPISEEIRKVILNKKNVDLTPKSEALLYAAARHQHLNDIIMPALAEDKIVICDRYIDSSYVYQGFARNLTDKYITRIHDFINKKTLPNITFLLDVDTEVGLSRVYTRAEMNRLDLEPRQFHTKVKEAYLLRASKNKSRFIILDANKDEEALFIEMIDKLTSHKAFCKYEKNHRTF